MNTDRYAISVRYNDDVDLARFLLDISVSITEMGTSSSRVFTGQIVDVPADNPNADVAGILVEGGLDLGEVGPTAVIQVQLATKPQFDDVVVGIDYATMIDAVSVAINPAMLTFDDTNWDDPQPLTLVASTDAANVTIDFAVTISTTGSATGDNAYLLASPSPGETDERLQFKRDTIVTLNMMLKTTDFLEVGATPDTAMESATLAITYSLTDDSDIGTRLTFRTDPPDLPGVRFIPSDITVITSIMDHTVHVTYHDEIDDDAMTNINVVIADADDDSRSGSQLLTFTDEDTAGLLVEGVDVTTGIAAPISLGVLRVGGTEDIEVRLGTQPTGPVTVSVTHAGMAVTVFNDITSTISVTIAQATLTFDETNWNTSKSFTLTTSTDSTVALTIDYQITVGSGSSDDTNYSGLVVTLDATFETSRFTEEDVAATEAALAVVDLGAAQFALDAIGGNFIGGRTQLAPSLNLNGVSGAAVDPADPWMHGDGWRDDFVSLLDGGSFSLPLGTGTGLGSLNVWGEGRLFDVSGDGDLADDSTYTYDGSSKGFVLGLGLRSGGGRLGYGIAVARTSSNVDLEGGSLTVERIDNDLVTLLPYVGMSFGANSRAWLVGGVGEGEAELHMSGEVEKTDSTVRSLGLGLEHTVQRGEYDLSGRLLASGSRSTLDGTEELPDLANVRGTAHRIRAEAEAERDMDLGGRGDGRVFGVAAIRRDGGDIGGSFGLELGVGMRALLHDAYTVELEGRHQVNSSSHEESSVRLRLGYDTHGDGRGLGIGLDESGAANVGYGWGRTLLGRHGVLSVGVGREGFGEVATTKLGFVSPGLRMSVAGDADEYKANFDLIVLGR